jgi:membrane-associated phospholipid phosphatase
MAGHGVAGVVRSVSLHRWWRLRSCHRPVVAAAVLAMVAAGGPGAATARQILATVPSAPDGTVAAAPSDLSAALPEPGSGAATLDGVSAGMPVWRLLVVDAGSVLSAPARWDGRDWTIFGASVAAVAGLSLADEHLRTEALAGDARLETNLANDFRYFGNYAAFGVLGGFYIGGFIGHDRKAQETALDGLIASILGGAVITGVLKEVVGRSRPSTHNGAYDFQPFSGNASFPSGETTEAFAAGSVIATQYPHLWVEVACYGTASLVGFARMREDGHFASDVLAGALIGTTVGRAVVHLNRRLRARIAVSPLLSPATRGVTFRAEL